MEKGKRKMMKGKWQIVAAVIVLLVLAGIAAGLITAGYKSRRKVEPGSSVIDHTPDTIAPAVTDAIVPSILPTTAPTDAPTTETPKFTDTPEPTATIAPAATPEPTATPTAPPAVTPLYEQPKRSHLYEFRTYDQLAAVLTEESFAFYKLMRNGASEEYGPQYARFVQLFTDGTVSPVAPVLDGERMPVSIADIRSNGLFNLPWIEYYVKTSGELVSVTYLDLIEGHDLTGCSIGEVIALVDPSFPVPKGVFEAKNEVYTSARNKQFIMRDGPVDTIVFTREYAGGSIYNYCIFLLDGCIVCVDRKPTEEFYKTFALDAFEADMSVFPVPPAAVPRSTDPSKMSREEAIMLIRDGVNIIYSMQGYCRWYEGRPDQNYQLDRTSKSFGYKTYNEAAIPLLNRPLMEGYDPDSVRELINKTFVSDIAAVFNSNETFFDKFSVDDNGVWYFSYPDGAQYSYYYNFDFTEEELNGLVLDEETGTGWLRTHNRGMYDVYYRNEEVTIAVSFVWDNGWKLAELNTADAALREYASGFAATEFSADNARRVITTVLCDLYMWAHVDTGGLIEVALFDAKLSNAPKQVYRGARQYTRVTGTLSAPWIWSGYARRFMTDALADRLFSSGDYLLFTDDAVYSWAGHASDRSAFGDYGIERAQLEVLSANDTRATVRLAGWRYSDNVMDLDFEFELVSGVWKISGGNFIDTLDAIFASPETRPYPADADPSLIPPAPGNASRRSNYFLFRHGFDNAYNLTTYQDVHLKPGEALKIPVLWFRNEPLPEGTYELSVEFESSDSVRFELLSKDEAPECEVCFVATALKSGRATVRLYGSFDPDKLDSEALKGISNYPNAPNMLIDVVLTVYVD